MNFLRPVKKGDEETLTSKAVRTCSGVRVDFFSLSQSSLASDETRVMNSAEPKQAHIRVRSNRLCLRTVSALIQPVIDHTRASERFSLGLLLVNIICILWVELKHSHKRDE
jgi:hypothetical protein